MPIRKAGKFLLIYIMIAMLSTAVRAQRAAGGFWVAGVLPVVINKKWSVNNDIFYRTANEHASQLAGARSALRYSLNKANSVAAGAAVFYTCDIIGDNDKRITWEMRLHQEYASQFTIKKLLWQNRLMAEERFFAGNNTRAAYHALRLRARILFTQPITNKWSFQFGNEYMPQLTHQHFSFNQNRGLAGFVYNISESSNIKAGYLWQLLPGHINRHIFNLQFQKTLHI